MTRIYARKFDHDEARARYAAGETVTALAQAYGVTDNAIRWAVVPGAKERGEAYRREWIARGRCDDCGGPMNKLSRSHGSTRCRQCATVLAATSVRDHELQCSCCRRWKPDSDFPQNRGGRLARRGRHQNCRVCQTTLRQAYRERHKVPCVGCGKPALPPNEKSRDGVKEPRCRACMYVWMRARRNGT